jgi:hypothetical protein
MPKRSMRDMLALLATDYIEILAMEEKVLLRIRQLMNRQSDEGRREVELTNIPVVLAQAERFQQRLGYWQARVVQLGGKSKPASLSAGVPMLRSPGSPEYSGSLPERLLVLHRRGPTGAVALH